MNDSGNAEQWNIKANSPEYWDHARRSNDQNQPNLFPPQNPSSSNTQSEKPNTFDWNSKEIPGSSIFKVDHDPHQTPLSDKSIHLKITTPQIPYRKLNPTNQKRRFSSLHQNELQSGTLFLNYNDRLKLTIESKLNDGKKYGELDYDL